MSEFERQAVVFPDRPGLQIEPSLAQVIVDRSMEIVGCNVNVMDVAGMIIASGDRSRIGSRHEGAALVLARQGVVEVDEARARELRGVRPGINLPLWADGVIVGCVGLTGDPNDLRRYGELIRMAAESMLEYARLTRLVAHDTRLREELVLGLIRSATLSPALADWAARLGIDLAVPRVASVIEVDGGALSADRMLVELQHLHSLLSTPGWPNLIATVSINELVVLRPALNARGEWDATAQRDRIERLHARMRDGSSLGVRIALGGYFTGPGSLVRSYQAARTTLAIGKARYPQRGALTYAEVALPVLLDGLKQGWQADELRKPLAVLASRDKRRQLRRTLAAWFDANMQMTATAERLNIHRNTLDYRIRRIEEITGLSLSATEDRVRLYLALEMGDA